MAKTPLRKAFLSACRRRKFLVLAMLMGGLAVGQTQIRSQPLRVWSTYYYVPTLPHDPEGMDLLDGAGKPTGFRLDPCSWCQAAIEGTVVIQRDGQDHTLQFAGRSEDLQVDCRKCPRYGNYSGYAKTGRVLWKAIDVLGLGVQNYQLVPFRSLAVDPAFIPYGSLVYIPAAAGVRYTDPQGREQVHDGYFFAADTGAMIQGNHIDVFLGKTSDNPFRFIQSRPEKTVEAYLVQDEARREQLKALHRGG